ncbi:speedy protein 1-B-like [Rhinoderma darwinii]|uniref:speedy protein 1-B-like n=1 Tax=Rhinoderma darwinii TaxID=43563 RepID=UPI003F661D39
MRRSVQHLPSRARARRRGRMTLSCCQKSGQLFSHSLYLLAMVLMYFRRAGLRTEEYRTYFFPCLFLANQFEEDIPFHREIYTWARGWKWTLKKEQLLHLRNLLLIRMTFRAWVDRTTCDLIMAEDPDHWAWKRERKIHHSWAIHRFRRDDEELRIKCPWISPLPCHLCNINLHPCKGEVAENILSQTDTKEEPGTADS